jgi:hypothetical protein
MNACAVSVLAVIGDIHHRAGKEFRSTCRGWRISPMGRRWLTAAIDSGKNQDDFLTASSAPTTKANGRKLASPAIDAPRRERILQLGPAFS